MQRITLIAATIVSVLVIAYGGWLSAASSSESGGGNDGTSQTDRGDENGQGGKPGEVPKP
jgi:hypothetical protein